MRAGFMFGGIPVMIVCWFGYGCGHRPEQWRTDASCEPFPGIVLQEKKTRRLENGSLLDEDDELAYPADSYRVLGNEIIGCVCNLRACLKKCCGRDKMLGAGDRPNCTSLPDDWPRRDLVLRRAHLVSEIREIGEGGIDAGDLFRIVEDGMDCPENTKRFVLEPDLYEDDTFVLERNGTLRTGSSSFPAWSYCLDWKESFEKIAVVVCVSEETELKKSYNISIMVSIPFFLATFLVYAIIPELRSLYGKTLMCYVACLVVAYTFLVLPNLFANFPVGICAALAFIIQFSFLASFFWLNVMCFDIWWTFGGFRSLQGSVKQRERKKFVIYSIYAWGCASILTSVCAIMDFLPSVPDHFIRPQFGEQSCWFKTDEAKAIYFYVPMGVTVVCNICLFISTALKIVQHKKDTANHLKGVDSRRHDDNKQWFNLYLKLFIVMGINWSMEIVSWLCHNTPTYIWYLTDLTNTLQGVIIFLIFVWKEKIRQLLLKRFRCRGRNVLSRNSTRSAYHSSASRTCTTNSTISTQALPLSATGITTAPAASTLFQEKYNPYSSNAPLRTDNKTLSNDSNDCP
ncbi:putative G-protein coupled receptor Mth-like 3 isoform X2 [Halictus rubicundus]|uniref:putative G-protein coupled receptor Mth-like 3 isoform X2 n=1 Tax=Halictus rubicundus TaxID=77578 RepID=UPI0040355215